MAVYSRLIVNLTKNRVKYSAAKIVGLLQRSKNKCKLIFLHCNKESNYTSVDLQYFNNTKSKRLRDVQLNL